jgi:hypothetical protein
MRRKIVNDHQVLREPSNDYAASGFMRMPKIYGKFGRKAPNSTQVLRKTSHESRAEHRNISPNSWPCREALSTQAIGKFSRCADAPLGWMKVLNLACKCRVFMLPTLLSQKVRWQRTRSNFREACAA